jgi:hypothetical protein
MHEYFSRFGIDCTEQSAYFAYLYDGDYPAACLARHYRDEALIESRMTNAWRQM